MNIEVHAPSMLVLVGSLFLAFIALIGAIVAIPGVTAFAFWLAFMAYVILALGTIVKTE